MKIAKLLLILPAAILVSAPAFAQDDKPMGGDKGMKMKAMHEEMQAEMKAMDERLDKLVVDMNTAATPEKKLNAVVAVVNEIAAQHKKMHGKMMHRWEGGRRHHGPGAGKDEDEKAGNRTTDYGTTDHGQLTMGPAGN